MSSNPGDERLGEVKDPDSCNRCNKSAAQQGPNTYNKDICLPDCNRCNGYSPAQQPLSGKNDPASQKRSPSLTEEEIKRLWYELKAGHCHSPSTRELHKILGHGSFSTIQKVVDKCEELELKSQLDEASRAAITDPAITELARELASLALKHRFREMEEQIEMLKNLVIKQAEQNRRTQNDLAEQIDEQHRELTEAKAANAELQARLDREIELHNDDANELSLYKTKVECLGNEIKGYHLMGKFFDSLTDDPDGHASLKQFVERRLKRKNKEKVANKEA